MTTEVSSRSLLVPTHIAGADREGGDMNPPANSPARETAKRVDALRPGAYKQAPIRQLERITPPGSVDSVATSHVQPEAVGVVADLNEPEELLVALENPPTEPEGVMFVIGEPREFRVFNAGNNGASCTINSCCEKETNKAQACFERMRRETFNYLCNMGKLKPADWEQFTFEVTKDRIGIWECGDLCEKIDFLSDLWTPSMQKEFALFDTMFLGKRPRGMSRTPMYQPGYMSDVSAKNGFAITSPQVKEKLPKTMGAFIEGHLGRILGAGATPTDYYNKMRDLAIMDCHRKAAITATEKAIKKLDKAILRLGDGPHNPRERASMEEDKRKLEGVLGNLRSSDQFAANFAASFQTTKGTRIEAAHELSKAAKRHLEGITTKGWFSSSNLELTSTDREYCDLMGTLMLQDRVNGFSTYCDQKRIARGNTAVEHNFLLANLGATLDGNDQLQGMEMFSGLNNRALAREIEEAIQTEGRDKANEVVLTSARALATVPAGTKPDKVIAHFKEHVYGDGWK